MFSCKAVIVILQDLVLFNLAIVKKLGSRDPFSLKVDRTAQSVEADFARVPPH